MELIDRKEEAVEHQTPMTKEPFPCRCGAPATELQIMWDGHGGMLLWNDEKDQVEEKAGWVLSGFLEAIRSKAKRAAWLKGYYGEEDYADNVSDIAILFDVLLHHEAPVGHPALRCPTCGRLYIQTTSPGRAWECFKPDDEQGEAE